MITVHVTLKGLAQFNPKESKWLAEATFKRPGSFGPQEGVDMFESWVSARMASRHLVRRVCGDFLRPSS